MRWLLLCFLLSCTNADGGQRGCGCSLGKPLEGLELFRAVHQQVYVTALGKGPIIVRAWMSGDGLGYFYLDGYDPISDKLLWQRKLVGTRAIRMITIGDDVLVYSTDMEDRGPLWRTRDFRIFLGLYEIENGKERWSNEVSLGGAESFNYPSASGQKFIALMFDDYFRIFALEDGKQCAKVKTTSEVFDSQTSADCSPYGIEEVPLEIGNVGASGTLEDIEKFGRCLRTKEQTYLCETVASNVDDSSVLLSVKDDKVTCSLARRSKWDLKTISTDGRYIAYGYRTSPGVFDMLKGRELHMGRARSSRKDVPGLFQIHPTNCFD